mgnify:CR=1 FL=1
MALTNWNDILNKPNGIDEVPEIALTVEQLSASVLSISEDVGEIALDVSQLSASVLTIGEKLEQTYPNLPITNTLGPESEKATLHASGNLGFVEFGFTCQNATQENISIALPSGWRTIREGVVLRDNVNGNLISAYVGAGANLSTFNHVGTMTVGNLCFGSMKAIKESN